MDHEEKAVDVAVHATNHQITIASALLAGIVAFSDKLKDQPRLAGLWNHKLWVMIPLLLAILFGIVLLLGIGGALAQKKPPFRAKMVRLCGVAQNVFFLAAMIAITCLICFV
jgi:hypothetical protein